MSEKECSCNHHQELASLRDQLAAARATIDKARRETASDPDNRWCRNATIILNAALNPPPADKEEK